MFYGSVAVLLLISPFSYGAHNWTFNKNIIPKNMEDFQDQAKDIYYLNPKSKVDLENMIAHTEDVVPDFELDVINQTSNRFEEIKAKYEKKKEVTTEGSTPQANILRQATLSRREKRVNRNALRRAFALMTQFVYAARYKLTYGQVLRKYYRNVLEYRIGYCFALMRDIRQQQLALYSTMNFNFKQHLDEFYTYKRVKSYADFQSYFQLYEKIVKLDINMLDVVALVQQYIDLKATDSSHQIKTTSDSDMEYDDNDDDDDRLRRAKRVKRLK